MNDLIQVRHNISELIGKKFSEVFDNEVISSRNKWNSALESIINPTKSSDITIRIIRLNSNNKPYWQASISRFSKDLSRLISSDHFINDFNEKLKGTIFIFISDNSNEDNSENLFKSYLVLRDSDYLMNMIKKDYEIIKRKLKEKIDYEEHIESVNLESLVFKPKDSKPYKSLEYNGIVVSNKRYGWYFTKKFLGIVFQRSELDSELTPDFKKEEKILDYDFYKYVRKLKKSSRSAIANLDLENDYTQYMHVERMIEKDFISLVKNAISNNEKKLIFLVGNSGDGKSELLRILKNSNPDLYERCTIHNDATESYYVNKDSLYTLFEILEPFNDECLNNSNNECLIVAINMGIIGRLIDSADKNGYSKLKKKIINSSILKDNSYKKNNYDGWFEYLSFAEYSNFVLEEDGFDVSFIDEMFNKVFSESPKNFFRTAYERLPISIKKNCPVAMNYELISCLDVRKNIIQLLLYTHLIGRIMITPRIIWNFIYHLLMGTEVERMYNENSSLVFEEKFYIENIFYNKWYTKGFDNNIFEEIRSNSYIFDSKGSKDNLLNEVVINKSDDEKLANLISSVIDDNYVYLRRVILNNINKDNGTVSIGMKTLVRHKRFINCSLENAENIKLVNEFATLLYDYNNGKNTVPLRTLEKNLIKIIKTWNGKHHNENSIYEDNDFSNFRKSVKFEDDNVQIEFRNQKSDNRFYYNYLLFTYSDNELKSILEIDFNLFCTIKKIEKGYRLNLYERLDSIKLQKFINKIIKSQKSKYRQVIDHDRESFIVKDKGGYYIFKRG